MQIKRVWCAALIISACLWAGFITPAAAQLFGLNLGGTTATATAAPEPAPGKPMVLKKYTKRSSRSARRSRARKPKATHQPSRQAASRPANTDNEAKKGRDETQDAGEPKAAVPPAARPQAENAEARANSAKPSAWSAISPSIANARAELGGGSADERTAFDNTPAAPAASSLIGPAAPASTTLPSPPVNEATARQAVADAAGAADVGAPAASKATANEAPASPAASAGSEAPMRLMAAVALNEAAGEQTASNSDSPWSRTSLIGKIFVAFGGLLMLASAARLYIG